MTDLKAKTVVLEVTSEDDRLWCPLSWATGVRLTGQCRVLHQWTHKDNWNNMWHLPHYVELRIAQKLQCLTFAFVLGLFINRGLLQPQCSQYKHIDTIKQYEIDINNRWKLMKQVFTYNTANNAKCIYYGDHKFYHFILVNSSPLSAVYMRQWINSALVKILACRLFCAKPLSERVRGYFQLKH